MHFVNPNAFPIQDSRVNQCFNLASMSNSPKKYHDLIILFRKFLIERKIWLPVLRDVDQRNSWSDLKLLDKVFYIIGENKKCAT
jgi:hypothetical protein